MPNTTFYRPVRNYPAPLQEVTIQVDAPPQEQPKQEGAASLLQFLYPLSGILITVVSVFVYTSVNHGSPNYLIIAAEVSIIPLSVGVMFLTSFLQRRSLKRRLLGEHEKYRSYLADRQRRFDEIKGMQRQRYDRLYPDMSGLNTTVTQRQHLWERRPSDDDFLMVRVGVAPTPLCCAIDFHEDYKLNYVPALLQEARDLVAQNSHIDEQPIVISLSTLGTLAVTGQRTVTRSLVRAMLCQIAAFHSPDEVRIVGYWTPDVAIAWGWLKWLPHTRLLRQVKAEHRCEQRCMLAENAADFQELFITQIKPELERRNKFNQNMQADLKSGKQKLPHLVFVLDGFVPGGALARVPGLEEILRDSSRLGVTILCLVDAQAQEPAAIRARLDGASVFGKTQLTYKETAPGGKDVEFITPDTADARACEQMARCLAPLHLVDMDAQLDFSRDVRLLELQDIPSVDTLKVDERWRPRTEQQLLRVPIGRQKNGTLTLDLKEMAIGGFGPHGLVVGATGSGKSELLRTVVTSLALTHDPHTVNFVLVDFKAGAAFADFADLPHVAGIITNLENDPVLIHRMYASLLGEQQRRQNMLSRAGNLGNIRQYQAKWRKNSAMEPMPYLLIIVDEFAQLIANHEEFLALFTKFGQVGRSLGMHMMLATQRVDEGRIKTLEGHLRYRICLRTFKPEESAAVLGKPDAYFLPPSPGSGYFKVDDDIYTEFKTALISTPYVPASRQQVDPTTLIHEFTRTGRLVACQQQEDFSRMAVDDELSTEMDVVIERIMQAPAPVEGWHVHPVWQPPLRGMIPLDEVLTRCKRGDLDGTRWYTPAPFGPLSIPIGLLDRPAEQVQEPMMLDFSGAGGHLVIVGAPQSGKSTLLRTIIASFMVTHSPSDVQLYCIDCGGGLLRVFDGVPHVGAVCGKTDRDKARRVLRRMRQIIVEREVSFAERGIDSMAAYRQLRLQGELPDEDLGDVFLLIDNLGQLQSDLEASDPDSAGDIAAIITAGLTYGVHVIVTANQWIEVRPRLRSNIGTRLELRLNDPGDSDIDRKQAATIPHEAAGRGLDPSRLLFQTAWPVIHRAASLSVQQSLEALVQRIHSAWTGPIAPQVLVLPQKVTWKDLPAPEVCQSAGVPIGLEEFRRGPMYIDLIEADPHFLVLGDRECGKTTLLRTWIHGIEQRYGAEKVKFLLIDYRKTLLDVTRSEHLFAYAFTPERVKECVSGLKLELEQRIEQSLSLPMEQLRSPQPWNGLHYFVFVDDYELIATPEPRMGNPLNPLEGLLQSGREIGFHLVLARRFTNFGLTNLDPVFRGIKNMESPGLIMRGDPIEGRQALHKQGASDTLPDGRGSLVRRKYPPALVQVASCE